MGTTADKLAYLAGTKSAIREAIIDKGVNVPDGTTFRQYASKIASIQDVGSLPAQGAKTVTPTTTDQIAAASGVYTTGDVKVAGDANLKAENIAEGVSIFGVAGTHSGGGSGGYSSIEFVNDSTFMQNQQRAAGILATDGSYWSFLFPPLIGELVLSEFGPLQIYIDGVGSSFYEAYDNSMRLLDESGKPRFEFSFSSGIVTNDIFQDVYFMLYI